MASYLSGLERYGDYRSPDGYTVQPALPAEVLVHAVHQRSNRHASKRVRFLECAEREARCGRVVEVLIPAAFRCADPGSCPTCVNAIARDDRRAVAIASMMSCG
jgi:hypothetical protein